MHIERIDLADARRIRACDEAFLAAQRADCPQEPRLTGSLFRGWLTVGWGGDPREVWLVPGRAGGAGQRHPPTRPFKMVTMTGARIARP